MTNRRNSNRRSQTGQKGSGPQLGERFSWKPEDVEWVVHPDQVSGGAAQTLAETNPELHTVLWALEHVTNQQSLDDAMIAVAGYMADDPTNQLVPEALRRAEERVKHVTQ